MKVSGLLTRFALIYTLLLVSAGIALTALEVDSNSGGNSLILCISIYFVCKSFAKKNQRYLNSSEKKLVIVGLILIDTVIQSLLTLLAAWGGNLNISLTTLLFAVGFISVLHGLVIYMAVTFYKKRYIKQGIISG